MSTRTAFVVVLLVLTGARPVSALDLESVLRQVASANPTLAARRSMAEAAQRRVAPAGAWQSPMVELGAVNVPTNGRFDMDPMTMKMIGVAQRVPLFGANRLSRRSAAEAASAERAAAAMTGYETFGMAYEVYADAYYADQLVREAVSHQSVMDRLVQSARARYEAGNGRLEDVLRAEAERARTLADLAAFRGEAEGARARLDALQGLEPRPRSDTLVSPPAVSVPADPSAWLAAVTPEHPRLREMDAQASRFDFAARAARRMLWPDLQLSASYGIREPIMGIRQDNMYTAMVGLMVPIFARSGELSMGAEMDAMAEASRSERRAAELDLREQVTSAWAAAAAAQRTVGLLADTVLVTQRRAVDASWVAYSAGTTDLWRVFEASHTLYQEQVALERARQDLARAQARLLALTGRGELLGIRLPETPGSQR
jgi:outer membrane protein TolC